MADHSYEKRFWAKVDRRGPDECWPWLGGTNGRGYGWFYFGDNRVKAHRIALKLAGRDIPPGYEPDHLCNNPGCQNERHIEIVTPLVNAQRAIARRVERARAAGTPAVYNAKFTREQVHAIRADPRGYRVLARLYGVNPSTMQDLKNKRSYAHL
jgi:hypothetical protein